MESDPKDNYPKDEHQHESSSAACHSMPDFTRMRYFHGQMLVANDLQTEQDYFREKQKLLNRCLQGYGTVCGLKVVPVKHEEDCDPPRRHHHHDRDPYGQHEEKPAEEWNDERHRRSACVEIECGLALDCEGNELVVRHPVKVDLWDSLADGEKEEVERELENDRRVRLYLSICYCVQPIDPVRPVIPDACTAVSECVYSKLRDTVKVRVSTKRPEGNHCRNNCCEKCKDKCLLLAAIVFERGRRYVIKNDVRRWITTYEPVTITGINWVHGADNYTSAEATKILRHDGLTIQFSRPILTETATQKGVVDVLIFTGGSGQHGEVQYLDGKLSAPDNRHLVFKYTARETLQYLDRVLVIVRTDFILDECCRPVDGNHTGGRVPLLPAFADNEPKAGMPPAPSVCIDPPRRYGAWTSGNGNPGGTFESWFYIEPEPEPSESYEPPPEKHPRYTTEDDY
jgi:hypothetical protein